MRSPILTGVAMLVATLLTACDGASDPRRAHDAELDQVRIRCGRQGR